MRETEFISSCGARVIIRDPLEPGTPEWEEREKRWRRATAEYMRKELIRQAQVNK